MRSLAVILLLMATPALADDKATAEALFLQAKELVKAGDYAGACPLYEQSFKIDPAIGAEINLADCNEHIGLLATAWGEYHDVEDRAHRAKDDDREAYARAHADALEPRLAKLKIDKPASPPPGLVVKRDGNDVTAILGVPMPIDPGQHVVEVSAPGYVAQKVNIAIAGEATVTPMTLPELAKDVDRGGHLTIESQPDADISIDGTVIGHGNFSGTVSTGRHVLRVIAPGMHPYQSDVYVVRDENRTVDVPLEREGRGDDGPDFETAVNLAPGVKLNGDSAAVLAYRAEIAFRIGRRVNFGLYVEAGSIRASDACASNMPGAIPSTPFDFGPHDQFQSCTYITPGLQLLVHILPGRQWDPYIGLTPGFRFELVKYVPYTSTGQAMGSVSEMWPAIMANGRVGVDYHPNKGSSWEVGAFVETEVEVIGNEADNSVGKHNAYGVVTLLGGVRTGVAF